MDDSVSVTVITFALVKDRLAQAHIESHHDEPGKYRLSLPRTWLDGQQLRAHLCKAVWPVLADIEPMVMLALNMDYLSVEGGQVNLSNHDTIALIPPITGG